MGKVSTETDKAFRISLPGYDVNTADPENFAVHSGFDYPKIGEDLEGYTTFTMPSSIPSGDTVCVTVNHNLGYIPFFNAYLIDLDETNDPLYKLPLTFDALVDSTFYLDISTTQFKISFYNQGTFGNITSKPAGYEFGFKYQIWVND